MKSLSTYFPTKLLRQTSYFALAAMLLLVLAPTVSRMIAHYSGAKTLVELCTSHGMMWVSVSPANESIASASDLSFPSDNSGATQSNLPKQSTALNKACNYCSPLFSAVNVVSPALTSAPAYTLLTRLPTLTPPVVTSAPLRLPSQARAPPALLFI